MGNKIITIDAHIINSMEKVWNFYTEPKHIVNWNFASYDRHCPEASNDLREGGTYFARMEAKDGSFGFDFTAIYDVVSLHDKLSYTLEDGRKVITLFSVEDGGIKVTTSFEAEDQNPLDMQKAGWQAILNNFKSYTETN